MSANVGLSTPRGSGTSGYVQRNLSLLKPKDRTAPYPRDAGSINQYRRKADEKILAHNRAREIEVEVFDLRDQLEDEGVDEEEIDARCGTLREKLTAESGKSQGPRSARGLKSHQVHELEVAKSEESERLRKALGIREDYEEGSHWKKQDERTKEAIVARGQEEARKDKE